MVKAILIGAAVIALGVAAVAVHFGIILRPHAAAAAQAVTQASPIFPLTDAGCARLYGGTQRVSTARAGDPFKYVDCKIARCHRVYAADALQFNTCVGAVGLDVDPQASRRQSATGASSASDGSLPSASPASPPTAQAQAVELARGMAAGLTSSGARGAACEAVALTPIKVACGFQNANGTAERVGATVTMVSPSHARITVKSSTVASYCIDSTSVSSKRKQAGPSAAVASRACP